MGRILRYLVLLALLAAAAGAVWALVADLPPPTRPIEIEAPPAVLK
jgi:hypothetical protein